MKITFDIFFFEDGTKVQCFACDETLSCGFTATPHLDGRVGIPRLFCSPAEREAWARRYASVHGVKDTVKA